MRGTGGNRFIEADAPRADLMRSINDQLGDLHEYASETGRAFDLGEVTIETKRISNGRISVSITADLGPSESRSTPGQYGDRCSACGRPLRDSEDCRCVSIPPAKEADDA